jgi:transcriptional regulator GlxA family with amidase domain
VLVRRALRGAQPGKHLVKTIALGHGFWHLGRFAQDYRALFGETPSETLAAITSRPKARLAALDGASGEGRATARAA